MIKDLKVIKRDGREVSFDRDKIVNAIMKAEGKEHIAKKIAKEIENTNFDNDKVTVRDIERKVVDLLMENGDKTTAIKYEGYRAVQEYKRTLAKRSETTRILNQQTRENANKNSDLIATKKGLILDMYITDEMLNHELPKHLAEAHKKNDIKFHDVSDRFFKGINCCLYDMKNVIDNNPIINGLKYDDANCIEAYLGVLSDVLLEASANQYGGFTINEIDHVLEDALENAYNKSIEYYTEQVGDLVPKDRIEKLAMNFVERAFRKRWNGIETRLNSISNSNMQVPFETIAFGNRTSFWARMVSRIILETRLKGCGKYRQTAIFPKLVFFYREEIHGKGGINEDLYKLAIECRSKREYPDFLSLDNGWCGEVWKKYGYALAPMGCRAYLSPWFEKGGIKPLDKNDKAIFNGRANCGAITINTVKPAIKYKGDKEAYFKEVKRCFDLATEGHLWTYNRMKDVKASTNPLFFCEGGCHIKLKPEETIEKAIKTFTWSYGYIGLNEASLLMTGKEIHEDNSFAIEVLEHFNKWKNEAIKKYGLLFAIYSTPAEGYAETCRNKDYEEFGLIPGVTDKKYYMNSFHVNVAAKINPFKKMEIEKPMFDLANGGHIVYTEYPINHNLEAISQSTRKAMELGLYEGVNFDSITCKNCGKTVTEYDPKNPKCNHCGSTKLIIVDRVCGYLSYYEIDGSTRVNDGKYQENQNRVVHYGQYIGEGIQDFDILNGDGLRTTIWFKGCPHRCEGCHNQGSWEYDKNYHIDCDLVVETCKKSKKLSVLGGEPLAPFNIKEATKIVKKVKEEIPDCSIYLWTGYEWDEVKNKEIITYLDKIICGKFIKDKKCENPMYGSDNQYIVDLK